MNESSEGSRFRLAGRTLFSLGLVKGAEGNLSTFDGQKLRITRTGARLDALTDRDVLLGGLDGSLPDASTDLDVHRRLYVEHGAGSVAHCHPPGMMPEDGGGPGAHGVYAFGASLEEAVAEAVRAAREAPS